ELIAVMRRATARRIEDRYGSVEEMADDLRRIQRDDAPAALPDSAWRAFRRTLRRNAVVAAATAAALVVGTIGVSAYAVRGQRIALAEQRAALEAHQKRDTKLMSAIGSLASRIDNDFLFYEGALEGLTAATIHALTYGAADAPAMLHYS